MEPEGVLPYAQESATSPCFESDKSSPRTPACFLKIPYNIIFLYTPKNFKRPLSLRRPLQNFVWIPVFPHTCHIQRPFHPPAPQFHYNVLLIFDVRYKSWSSSLCSFYSAFCYFLRLEPKYLLQHPVFEHPQRMLFPQFERTTFHSHTKQT